MYQPQLNSVLVKLDDRDANWGGGNDGAMLGKSYRKGKLVTYGKCISTLDHPITDTQTAEAIENMLAGLLGKEIMWNEGTEAGTVFEIPEQQDAQFAFIYWWDIRGEKTNV
jgi:hypothetical protein